MPQESIEKTPEEYQNVSFDDFVEYSKSMFEYWTEDDFASSFLKMLTIEQFRSEEMQNLYQQYLVSGPAEYVKDLFKNMEIKIQKRMQLNFMQICFSIIACMMEQQIRRKQKAGLNICWV